MTLRVLQLLLSPAIGGAETLAEGLGQGLPEHGFDVVTCYLDPPGSPTSPWSRWRRLRRLVRSTRPGLVLAHSALPNVYARLAAGRRVRVVTVLHSASRDFDDATLRRAEKLLQRRTATVVAVARQQAEEYASAFGDRVPVTVIPNGVSSALGARPPAPEGRARLRVLTLARVTRQKDPLTWRAAALLVVSKRRDVDFHWFGPAASDDETLQSLMAETGDDRVRWMGPVAAAVDAIADADLYFHPALAEAHPLAVLEAAAAGRPIVCSEAVAAVVPAGLPVATFPTANADAAAAALADALERLPEASGHARAWQPRILADYGLERAVSDYAEVLRNVLAADRRP